LRDLLVTQFYDLQAIDRFYFRLLLSPQKLRRLFLGCTDIQRSDYMMPMVRAMVQLIEDLVLQYQQDC
jgi:hypothetical protein